VGAVAVDLTVVVPVYNEADSIEALVRDVEREVVPLIGRIEVIIVDDASTDGTPAILDRLAAERPWLDVRHAERNAGHGPSVMRGLGRASADWIFQLDSDGQFVVGEFPRLWGRRHDADLVLGVRVQRHDPTHRLLLTRAVRLATSILAGRDIQDVNTPFRLLRRSLWTRLEPLIPPDTLAPNIHVTLGAAILGARTIDVSVTHLPRQGGTSTLRPLRLLRFSLRGLGQLVAFRHRVGRAPRAANVPAGRPG
jgi:glycosyltransferase involved in cell wall biosynthesis